MTLAEDVSRRFPDCPPLIALTQMYAIFKWTEDCQRAFDCLKVQLNAVLLLTYPDLSKPMVLYTDTSEQCIGAVLIQPCPEQDGPVYFLSHRLSETQHRWPVIERKTYTIIYVLQKLDYYLSEAVFTTKTDHKQLQYLLKAEWTNKKTQQRALKLSGYSCKIEYLAGRDADLLSRIPKQLEAECVKVEPGVDDRAYQIGVINFSWIRDCPVLEAEQK